MDIHGYEKTQSLSHNLSCPFTSPGSDPILARGQKRTRNKSFTGFCCSDESARATWDIDQRSML
jgi:hypothetical protein